MRSETAPARREDPPNGDADKRPLDGDAPPEDGRGKYDRRLTAAERDARRRVQIVAECAAALDRYGPVELTVSRILESVAIGRNTFYRYFADSADAVRGLREYAFEQLLRGLDAELSICRTPHARLRTFVSAWVAGVCDRPWLGRAIASDGLPGPGRTEVSAALLDRLGAIWRQALRDGATGAAVDPERARHAVAAVLAAGERAPAQDEGARSRSVLSLVAHVQRTLR